MNDTVLVCWDAPFNGLRTLSRVLDNLVFNHNIKISKVLYLYCEYMYKSDLKDTQKDGLTTKERIDFLNTISSYEHNQEYAFYVNQFHQAKLPKDKMESFYKLSNRIQAEHFQSALSYYHSSIRYDTLEIPENYIPITKGDSFIEIDNAIEEILLPELVKQNPAAVHISLESGTQAMKSTWITLYSQSVFNAFVGNNVTLWAFSDEAIKTDNSLPKGTEQLIEQKIKQNPYIASIETAKYKKRDFSRINLDTDGLITKTATINAPFLLLGERGTGKTFIIEDVYNTKVKAGILKPNAPRKTIVCGTLSGTLVDDALFGHWKGAFTGADKDKTGAFEECNNGLLFLDEIQDLPKETQRKILRAINEGKINRLGHSPDGDNEKDVHVALVCASNKTLQELQESNKLDPDFLDRIARFICEMKPLRELNNDQLRKIWNARWMSSVYTEGLQLPEEPDDFNLVKDILLESGMKGNIRDLNQLIAYIARDVYEGKTLPSLNKKKEKYQEVLKQWQKDYLKKYPNQIYSDNEKTKQMLEEYGWEGMEKLFKHWLSNYAKEIFETDKVIAEKMHVTDRTLRDARKYQ